MFRRRTTDQVYATLQQVQRRITEAGGNGPGQPPASGGGPGASAPAGARQLTGFAPRPLQTHTGLGQGQPAGLLPGPGGSIGHGLPPAGPNLRPTAFPATSGGDPDGEQLPSATMLVPAPSHPRGTLHLPLQIAITLFLLWIVTLIAAWWLGMRQGRNDGPVEQRSVATLPADHGKPQDPEGAPATGRLGDSLFVLEAVPSFDAATKASWQKEVDRLNALMTSSEQMAAKGWKPYFHLREPENGGLQFVYGYANGQYGIDRAKFEDLARVLAAPRAKGGGGHTSAKWMSVVD